MRPASTSGKLIVTLLAGAALCIGDAARADVTISSDATNNMSCSNGVCSPTASNAVLNVSDLESLLASANVMVTTTGSGGVQATNIDVGAGLSWSSQSALGLDANESIFVQDKVSVPSGGGLSLTTNDGGSGGVLMTNGGRIIFVSLSSPLSINGTSYTLVKTIAALARLIAKHPSGAYALSNDYDASVDGTYTKSPITTLFTGKLEGLGNTISNLTIAASTSPAVGLFIETNGSGLIENLGLTSVSIQNTKNRSPTGGLVAISQVALFNDHVRGLVSGANSSSIGGLVGVGDADIVASYSTAHVKGGKTTEVGGLVGTMNGGVVTDSYATGVVSSKYIAGGLVGENSSTVSGSFATGNVSAGFEGGGLVGVINEGVVLDSYATGVVTGGASSAAVGGLVGASTGGSTGGIGYSYSTGAVTGGASTYVGGFLGDDLGNILIDNYWDTDTSGLSQGAGNIVNDPGITGLTTQQFQSGLPTGFDPSIWAEDSSINNGFPYLIANPPPK